MGSLGELPMLGSGLGHRAEWEPGLRQGVLGAQWVEFIVERWAEVPAGVRAGLRELAVPVAPHGVGRAVDVPGEPDGAELAACAALVADLDAPWFSGHLWFAQRKAARDLGRAAQRLRDSVGAPFLLENTEHAAPDAPEFITEVLEHCECGLVLNLARLARDCPDPAGFLDRIPIERVVEAHLTAGAAPAATTVETHRDPVPPPVWDLLATLVTRAPLRGSVVERDGGGPTDVAEVIADLTKARALLSDRRQRP
ncbi:multinuclear nonheme iron-dependent oxidase [Actinokineospora iranica]|uniref:Sugar phosphate isomerase/epimerase n=1 Tax=Actinokineospora iranica TaxID=1271860 RepID=A0A1G6U5X1_9PSEU|nr:DUF692 family multinuclear iron-containing protein [Actinokineospora iranica]SDD36086.1 hypothetical protein SAMN05216174_11096 [Actinokineospora iranica]